MSPIPNERQSKVRTRLLQVAFAEDFGISSVVDVLVVLLCPDEKIDLLLLGARKRKSLFFIFTLFYLAEICRKHHVDRPL